MTDSRDWPDVFLERYRSLFDQEEAFEEFLEGLASWPEVSIRYNQWRVDREVLISKLESYKINLEEIPWCSDGFWVSCSKRELTKLPEYRAGWFYLQEASSMLPVELLDVEPGGLVLDMCAAPGSKTTQIVSKWANSSLVGGVLANDSSFKRIKALQSNVLQQGYVEVALSVAFGQRLGNDFFESFDRVLLDAPCSGEGMIGKKKDFFRYWSLKKIKRVQKTQQQLLIAGLKALKPGGVMVYSTCTLAPEENEANIQWLLDRYKDLVEVCQVDRLKLDRWQADKGLTVWQSESYDGQLERAIRLYPHRSRGQSFFAVVLRKVDAWPVKDSSSLIASKSNKKDSFKTWRPLPRRQKKELISRFFDLFGVVEEVWEDYFFWQRASDEKVWGVEHRKMASWRSCPYVQNTIIPLGYFWPSDFRPSFEFCFIFGKWATKNKIELTSDQWQQVFKNQTVDLDRDQRKSVSPGFVVLAYNGQGVARGHVDLDGGLQVKMAKRWL